MTFYTVQTDDGELCRSCGACCAFSKEWPRFSTEDEADLDAIPAEFIDRRLGGLRCEGDRCSALAGEVGLSTSCLIYAVRPDVCRACTPGDDACRLARRHFGLAGKSMTGDLQDPDAAAVRESRA